MYEIIGRKIDSPSADPILFSFSAIIAEYDPDISGVRFTLPEANGVTDVLLPNVGKDKAEDIIRRGRCEALDLCTDGVMHYDDGDYGDDDWNESANEADADDVASVLNPCELDEKPGFFRRLIGKSKKAARKRVILVAIALLLIVAFAVPVWNVQIQGDSESYDLFVLVYDDPTDNIAPMVVDWSLLPHLAKKVRLEGSTEEYNASYTWNTRGGRFPLVWEELDREIDSDLQANVPLALTGFLQFPPPYDLKAYEVLCYLDGNENSVLIANEKHTSCMRYVGDLVELTRDGENKTLYGGIRVYIAPKWLDEKCSLATVLWNTVSGPGVQAEKIGAISLANHE